MPLESGSKMQLVSIHPACLSWFAGHTVTAWPSFFVYRMCGDLGLLTGIASLHVGPRCLLTKPLKQRRFEIAFAVSGVLLHFFFLFGRIKF